MVDQREARLIGRGGGRHGRWSAIGRTRRGQEAARAAFEHAQRPVPRRLLSRIVRPNTARSTMTEALAAPPRLDPRKFRDPEVTANGDRRAQVALKSLETLWFNTGTLCNLACQNCYIESSPKNDRLSYLSTGEAARYLDEIEELGLGTELIGFTGGEPFMNPDLPAMLEDVLSRGLDASVLTNAMKPMHKVKPALLALHERYGDRLTIRVSIDHYGRAVHELER